MADTRTMAQLLQAPTEGYEDAILIPEILSGKTILELKHWVNQVLSRTKQFFRHDIMKTPHAHILTSTRSPPHEWEVPNVPIATIKLMLFLPFSLSEGEPRIWLEKEPPRSIPNLGRSCIQIQSTQIFSLPQKPRNLRNEITRFSAKDIVRAYALLATQQNLASAQLLQPFPHAD
ncbi:hypothetical protein Tco_1328397 [Tanacetum coccineum]